MSSNSLTNLGDRFGGFFKSKPSHSENVIVRCASPASEVCIGIIKIHAEKKEESFSLTVSLRFFRAKRIGAIRLCGP